MFRASDDWDETVRRMAVIETLIDLNLSQANFELLVQWIVRGIREIGIVPESASAYLARRSESLHRQVGVHAAQRPGPMPDVGRPLSSNDLLQQAGQPVHPAPPQAAQHPAFVVPPGPPPVPAEAGDATFPVMNAFRRARPDPGSVNPADRQRPRLDEHGVPQADVPIDEAMRDV